MKKRQFLIMGTAALINFILFAVKLYVGISTNCLCIYTDSINNLADTLSLTVGIIGTAVMFSAPTKNFPQGFGRAEYITGLFASALTVSVGFALGYGSVERFFAPLPIWYLSKYAVIIGCTALIKLALGLVFLRLYKRDGSPVSGAFAADSFADCGITLTALASFILSPKLGFVLDAFLGLAISIVILVSGARLVLKSIRLILGTDSDFRKEKAEKICEEVSNGKARAVIHDYGRFHRTAQIYISECKAENRGEIQKVIKKRLADELGLDCAVEWES